MKVIKSLLLVAFLVNGAFAQNSSQNKVLDQFIIRGMSDWKIPGLSALVVKDGEVVFKKAYGIKDIETKEKVDENTLFNMASTTKAIICISMGILVDEGKLNWDDPVVKHYPKFKLSDPYITADARIKDLLIHNLGMGNADLLWVLDSISTEEIIKKFQIPDKAYPLRGGYTYQNIMYAIAGEVIQEVSGLHWTDFVRTRVFEPLEMTRSVARSKEIFELGNYTSPHWDDWDDGIIKVPYTFFDNVGAAGIIWSCINDMDKYMTFLLNKGVVNGDTLLQPKTFDFLFKPHSFVSDNGFYPTQKLTQPNWKTYGLGWFQHDYRGEKLNFHTGSIAGLVAIAGIIPERGFGVYVFSNLDHAELRHAIMYKALDLYLYEDNDRDWHKEVFDMYMGLRKEGIESQNKFENERVPDTEPSLPIDSLTGTYIHKMNGKITVAINGWGLTVNVNDWLLYRAEHWHYNAFITNKDPRWRNRTLINFNIDSSGKVEYLEFGGAGKFYKK